jgi:hypothetical protein
MFKSALKFVVPVVLFLGSSAAHSEPVKDIVFDIWWNRDIAERACRDVKAWFTRNRELINQRGCDNVTACPKRIPSIDACLLDYHGGWYAFETKLMASFMVEPQCKGVRFEQSNKRDDLINTTQTVSKYWF